MEAWIGPAILAAVIAALISVVGWFVTFRQSLQLEQRRRDEKVHDFMIALRAEIRGGLKGLEDFGKTDEILSRIQENYDASEEYSVTVPSVTPHVIFEAIVSEIHILPEEVIDDVVLYYEQHNAIAQLAEDMRAERFNKLAPKYQMQMYEDYLHMRAYQRTLAVESIEKLETAIAESIAGTRSGLPRNGLWIPWHWWPGRSR
jgi:hypothetical protein